MYKCACLMYRLSIWAKVGDQGRGSQEIRFRDVARQYRPISRAVCQRAFMFSSGISGMDWSGPQTQPPPGLRISITRITSARTSSGDPPASKALSIPPHSAIRPAGRSS